MSDVKLVEMSQSTENLVEEADDIAFLGHLVAIEDTLQFATFGPV